MRLHLLIPALLTALAPALPVLALDEQEVREKVSELLLSPPDCPGTGRPFWQRETVPNPSDGYGLRLSRFGCDIAERGAVLIAPGRTESSPEYAETALDLIDRGFGPIFVVDHRGQGLSPRLLPDPMPSHVDRFEDYVDDLETAVGHARKEIGDVAPLHLISSSMGGAIVTGYLQQAGADAPVTSAVMLGAMIRVNYFSFIDKPATRLNLSIYAETGALLQARWRCDVRGRCAEYAVAEEDDGAHDPESREFKENSPVAMTHSRTRYELRDWIWDGIDWPELTAGEYAPGEVWDGPVLGAATVQWVREAARFNREMRLPRNMARMTHVPLLMMTGTEDLRAYREHPEGTGRAPDLHWHETFCDGINTIATAERRGTVCSFVPVEGAYHELLKESDVYRDPVLDAITTFFVAAVDEDRGDMVSKPFPAPAAATMSPSHGQETDRSEL